MKPRSPVMTGEYSSKKLQPLSVSLPDNAGFHQKLAGQSDMQCV